MYGKRVLEIAVYRKEPAEMVADLETLYLDRMLSIAHGADTGNYKSRPAYQNFWETNGDPYPFNQVVGWLILWTRADSILGEAYSLNGTRLNHACKRLPFQWLGPAFDISVFEEDTDATIPARIREELRLLTRSGTFKNRWIDLESFDNLSPYVQWRKVIDESIL